ncbi:ornithine cyclodeaminase [Francisella orientalis]|uniref:Ornithine cyclodeaminase n=1 Tax=Francisella orientalis TaxID=299583 RepID=A0AAP7C5P5_9GAMM|nr:ornithine cyclodeaminase [Francisella orientalis]AFJ43262.1 acyl-CoA dehydrogenase [Francisella orientalis str. Toba 04]AHB98803.1 ornithine cyclodeaminase [Francisella orientalis LADL 07-285A]AKN86072.1 Ornithine cyclodeaminase [Francisella orientalis FNO12]AKN87610.1 Ornithine cyclodeaminase [Francisella orientalis FNO24]AKN89148.1 Ornithine cyclodeaminase [Francisella orientalis]
MRILSVQDIAKIVQKRGFDNFIRDLVEYTKQDFIRWQEFDKSPRYAAHVPGGVLELMPTADNKLFTYKCVNGHPANPFDGKQTVVATGQLNEIKHGYPLLISEMTVLTALRTAAATVLATDYLARKDSKTMALIGTGAQSEFQTLAHKLIRPIQTVRYFDTDPKAMKKYANNMKDVDLEFIACDSAKEACEGADIIVVCTACKLHAIVIENDWVKEGVHISGLGGDCPGKTELDMDILFRGKVVVEYKEQSMIEGEIQNLSPQEVEQVLHAEVWEILTGKKKGRENDKEITIYDSVGFAIEDFSALRLTLDLAEKYDIGIQMDMVPPIKDPKNLFSVL